MTSPTTHPTHVANLAHHLAKDCKNEKLAMTLQYVALGSMLLMGTAAAAHLVKDTFGSHNR